jgi:hypothetical protein
MAGKLLLMLSTASVAILCWSNVLLAQEEPSVAGEERSLPVLDLSDVVVVGVEEAGKPQGRPLRALPNAPTYAVPSPVVNLREYPEAPSGSRLSPTIFFPVATPFLTMWAGGANYRSADALAIINGKGANAQGTVSVDWMSQDGPINWMDRHHGLVRANGSLQPSESLLLGIQARLEEHQWRAYGADFPAENRHSRFGAGDGLAEWSLSPDLHLNARLASSTWIGKLEDPTRQTTSNRIDAFTELQGNTKSFGYVVGFNGDWLKSKDTLDTYDARIVQVKGGLKVGPMSRATAGATFAASFWQDTFSGNEIQLFPEGFVGFDLWPLFSLRVQGGASASIVDIAERWELNPYLDEYPVGHSAANAAPWVERKPAWVSGEVSRSIGTNFRVRGWGGWEKVEKYPVFTGVRLNGLFSSDPDTVEISRAGLGFWWQPAERIAFEISGERVWSIIVQSTFWDGTQAVPEPRTGGVPFLEDGWARAKVSVKPAVDWTVSLWGDLHGKRPNWNERNDLPSYGTLSAEILWELPGPFMAALWGANLTDTRYEAWPGYQGEPFRIGVRFGFHAGM